MASKCPRCSARARATVGRTKPVGGTPELTSVSWRCPGCGWRSDRDGFVGRAEDPLVEWPIKGPDAGHQEADGMLLTDRERAVVRLIAQGLTNQEIADQLNVTVSIVKNTSHAAYQMIGVHSRPELVLWAIHHGLVPNDDD